MKTFVQQQMTQKRRNASVLASPVAKVDMSFCLARLSALCAASIMGNGYPGASTGVGASVVASVFNCRRVGTGIKHYIIRGSNPQVAGG